MTNRLDLPRRYREQLETLLREHLPGVEVWAYGSRVNGRGHEASDLDLVLRGPALAPLDGGFYDLLEAIEKSNVPILIQAHDWAMLPKSFHREIERDYVVLQEGANPSTPFGWREVTLGELGQVARGRSRHRPRHAAELYGGPYPFVQTGNIKASGGRITTHTQTYSEAGLAQSRLWPAGTMVVTIAANIAETAILTYPACFPDSVIGFVADDIKCDVRFIEYTFRLLRDKLQHENVGTGSVQDNINLQTLARLRFLIPSLPEQRAIAHVLGTLDDKIELNRRMNETLEEMARALFKSWFVEFEPVRAKMEGRWRRGESLPGLPADLYDLFPDRLVNSELGEVPEGWGVRGLDSIANFLNGLALQKYPATDGSTLPVIKITQLRAGHTLGADSASNDLPPQYVVHDGDVLFSWSGSLELDLWAGGEGALNQHLFKVTSEKYPKWLYYRWIGEHLRGFRAIAAGKTTTMGHIQRHHLSEALTVVPDAAMLKAMDCYMQPLVDRNLALRIDARTLAIQRDALLPRLVSGEMRMGSKD